MRLWRILTLPGHALSQTARLVCLALAAAFLATGIFRSASAHVATLHWMLHSAHLWGTLNAFLWLFLASTIVLARDARVLRLPALERDALVSLGLYGALGIALPAALVGWASGHLLTVIIMLLFGAGLGAAYALLPAYLSPLALFADSLPSALSTWFSVPLPAQPGFDSWAAPAVAALWLVLGWRIHGLLRGDQSLQRPHGPMIVMIRFHRWGGGNGASGNRWGVRTPGQGPVWARPKIDLHGCGPGHPARSLRVALGGGFVPQTWQGRLRQCALLLTGILAGALILLTQFSADHRGHAANLGTDPGGVGTLVFFITIASGFLALSSARLLSQRWGRTNAELSLLALLPGLGGARAAKRALLRASLVPAVGVQLALALLLLILAAVMHLGSEDEAFLLLAPLGSYALMCAFALAVFSARPTRGWKMTGAMSAGCLWIGVGTAIVQSGADPHVVLGHTTLLVLAIGWSVFFAAFGWMAQRGWRALQRQPHPFLAQ